MSQKKSHVSKTRRTASRIELDALPRRLRQAAVEASISGLTRGVVKTRDSVSRIERERERMQQQIEQASTPGETNE